MNTHSYQLTVTQLPVVINSIDDPFSFLKSLYLLFMVGENKYNKKWY